MNLVPDGHGRQKATSMSRKLLQYTHKTPYVFVLNPDTTLPANQNKTTLAMPTESAEFTSNNIPKKY